MALSIDDILRRGVAEIIVESEFREKLASGKRLRLKQGFDPRKPDLHIGHALGLRKLRQLQELGHQVVVVVGDWTARIGDPSGLDETRPAMTESGVKENAQEYMNQFFMVVDKERTEVRWQSEWYDKFTLTDVMNLTSRFTLQQLLAHETFRKRYTENLPVTMNELMYPLLQAYDSVAINADVEFGGMDQKFNILMGRELQRMVGQTPQDVFLVPLLAGTDGRKMSKSWGNTIDLKATPEDKYGKIMSLSDDVIIEYMVNITNTPDAEIAEMDRALAAQTINPRDLKMRLARQVVTLFDGVEAARRAEEEFVRVFQKREVPTEMEVFVLREVMTIVDLLVAVGFASSKSEARRLVQHGGVRIDEQKIEDVNATILPREGILRVGRLKFVRLAAR
jgi:tyrosyl-tRNA synthetase